MPSHAYSYPLFDLRSYARRGPGRRDRLTNDEVAQVSRTVRRTPEVMVKVLSRGSQDLKAVARHFDYLRFRKDGERDLETDDTRQLTGNNVTKELLEDWDLDLDQYRRRSSLDSRDGGSKKLVHKVLFSMPAGTPPDKVFAAVRQFAREEFGLKHRYAMVLHTDEPHPHVHLVLKAVSERGERLHIRKAVLRDWRQGFAHHLRLAGVQANATERAVRGAVGPAKLDSIYRPMIDKKRHSTHMQSKVEAVAAELLAGQLKTEAGKARLIKTRKDVEEGWKAVGEILIDQGQPELAAHVKQFAAKMPAPLTEKEQLVRGLIPHAREPRNRKFVR